MFPSPKKYSNKKELVNYLNQITKNYTIPVDNDDDKTQYPDEYPESYIVNESKIRFKNEIKQSHFLSHWKDLCKYTEVTSKLRFIYNLINIKKDPLISLLSSITHKIISSNVILENNVTSNSAYSQYFQKIINFLGLSQNDISRIKIDNQSFKTFKSSNTKICPSQLFEAPIPIVGILISFVIFFVVCFFNPFSSA